MVDHIRVVALLTKSGTACLETALYGGDDTPENRTDMEKSIVVGEGAPIPNTWTDVSDNAAFERGE